MGRHKKNKLVLALEPQEEGTGLIVEKEADESELSVKKGAETLDQYRARMLKLMHMKKRLIEFNALKRKALQDYNNYRKEEESMRIKLMDEIPNVW